MQNCHRNNLVAIREVDTAHTNRVTTSKDTNISDRETNALATGASQKHVVEFRTGIDREDFIALVFELHRDLTVTVDLNEVRKLITAYRAARGREHNVEVCPGFFILWQRHDRGNALTLLQRQHIDECLAARLRITDWQTPDFFFVDDAARREEQHRRMRIGDE